MADVPRKPDGRLSIQGGPKAVDQQMVNPVSQQLAAIPGVGPITAITMALTVDSGHFESGRHRGRVKTRHAVDPSVSVLDLAPATERPSRHRHLATFCQEFRSFALIMRQNVKYSWLPLRQFIHQQMKRLSGNVDAAMGDVLIATMRGLQSVRPAFRRCAQIDLMNRDGPVSPLDLINI
jgi:hypothetical protein